MGRANDAYDGGVMDQLRYRLLFFIFRLVFGGIRFVCRLRKIPKTLKY